MSKVRISASILTVAVLQACGGGGGSVTPAPLGPLAALKPTSTSTAQAIWTDFGPDKSEVLIQENYRYVYQTGSYCQGPTSFTSPENGICTTGELKGGASSYYNATPTAVFAWGACNGSQTNCSDANKPSQPAQPTAPSLTSLLGSAECPLWFGTELPTLADAVSGSTNGVNGKGNYTWSWTFSYAPVSPGPFEAKTAFGYNYSIDDSVSVALAGNLYGQSAKKGAKDPGPKYSFSMRASDGAVRVANVNLSWIKDGDSSTLQSLTVPSTSIELQENLYDPVANTNSVDFKVTTEAGALTTNGDTSLLAFSTASVLKYAAEVLNGDWFAGNNNGGSDGSALARVRVDAGAIPLSGSGTYSFTLSASVKELTATGSVGTVTSTSKVVIGGQPNSCH